MANTPISFETLTQRFAGHPNVAAGKWFGKTCLKVDGKALVVLFGADMAFKLAEGPRAEALAIEGAHLFDPRGQGNAFKEWVQVPAAHSQEWPRFAEHALEFVGSSEA